MSHNEFTRPGGVWYPELVPGAADYRDLDLKQSKSIDGDGAGGTYNPSSPILIGGAGMTLASSGGATPTNNQSTGGVLTQTGGRVYMPVASSDFPVLNDRVRTITFPALRAGVSVGPNVNFPSQLEESWLLPVFGPFGSGISFVQPNQPSFFMVNIPRRCMHNGAQLITASIQFAITQRPQTLPTTQYPRFTIIGHDYFGNLTSGFPTPNDLVAFSSPALWTASTAYAVGAYAAPRAFGSINGLYSQVLSVLGTGTSGGAEPVWPTVVGNTVVDNPGPNQITWITIGRSGIYPMGLPATPDSYYANGKVQSVYFDPDPAAVSGNLIDDTTNRYAFYFPEAAIDPAMVLTSFTLSFGRIRLYGQE